MIRWENLEFKESTTNTLYAVSAVVIVIIIVTSVFCIRNSFEISITEKTKQYGMLASVGATSKQIKKNVLYEGLILGLIGVPIGILSGLVAIFVLLKIISNILKDFLGTEFIYTTSFLAIAISILLAGVTIYLSARKSAKKASKISPIEAIRNTDDIKINANTVDTFTCSSGSAISGSRKQENFARGKGNQTGSTYASAMLTANKKTKDYKEFIWCWWRYFL